MQKKLIALAVAALATGSAFAQSNVTISGYISQGYANTKVSNPGTGSHSAENRLDDGRYSRIRFTGTEDLGNGMKAEFQMETRFAADQGQDAIQAVGGFNSGDVWVGLNGGFGRVRLGRMDTYYSDGILTELSRATSFQSYQTLNLLAAYGSFSQNSIPGNQLIQPFRLGRSDNQIRYDSPNFSGFSGTVAYSFRQSGVEGSGLNNGSTGGVWYLSGRYLNGPIYVGASWIDATPEGGNSATAALNPEAQAYRLYGSYTFPFGLKLGLNIDSGWYKQAVGAKSKRTAWFLPVTYSFGNNSIYFSYGRANDSKGDGVAAANNGVKYNNGAKMWNLGYDYALSKRTSVGVNYSVVDNDGNNVNGGTYRLFAQGTATLSTGLTAGDVGGTTSAGAMGTTNRQLYVGVNHNF